ncbi:MAG: lipid-A-disaccharide synthase N-terminal domain-containing protein [Muribaculum sp.]|nr:lipid-A-disaccharide synthase N-terminal domain-containing protein [Muribaculum sp.]
MFGQSWIYAIGFLAQGFFSARILVQWLMSEKARRVLSPTIFWVLSIIGSYMLCVYGWLRDDFAIVLGQCISYYIYLWNLNIKGVWKKVPLIFRIILLLTPVVAAGFLLEHPAEVIDKLFRNEDIPLWLVIYGCSGQILFTLRFIYQWYYSRKAGESELPAGFWIISLTGSLLIVSYAVIRHDPVLIIGQSFGLVAYIRNLCILHKQKSQTSS